MIVCVLIMIIQNLLDLKKEHSILSWIKEFSQTNEIDYGGIFNLIMLTLFCIFINTANDFIGNIQNYIIESRLFKEMLEKIMGASIPLFFEKTPSGKIINRFGDDLSTANYLSNSIKWYISNIIEIAMTLVYVSYYVPTSLFIVPVTIGVFILIMRDFMKVSKEMRRVSRTVYSPILTHLSESVDGVSTIRTYKKTHQFEDKYCEFQDRAYIVNIIDNGIYNWLSFRLNIISLVFIAYYYVNWIYSKEGKDPIMISLMIGYLTGLPWRMSSLINDLIWIDGNMVSFERCLKLLEIPQEAEQRRSIPTDENSQPWMSKGHVKFRNYSVKYRPDTEVVLKDLNVDIQPGEKIGIVGRTGAGKSTLCLSLCRVLEALDGQIEIDGVDISSVGLSDLRDRITIIPQEPILFNNTLRFNLDPENKRTDKEVKEILEKACLKDLLIRDGNGLDFKITEKGSNLSAGEKALICIWRAILRKNKVVLLDEATASIDLNTEEIIQKLILEEFKVSTVLTVAHRLNTIMHSDKIAVMNCGNITEFDTIENLKENPNSEFSDLLNQFNK